MLSAVLGLVLAVVGATPAVATAEGPFEITPGSFVTEASTAQAGAHPDLRTKFALNQNSEGSSAGATAKNLNLVLPKGLIGAPTATPTCSMRRISEYNNPCPLDAAVGDVVATLFLGYLPLVEQHVLVYNVPTNPGEPAALGFYAAYPVRLDTHLRADGDYGVTVNANNLTEAASILGADLTIWGVPADHNGPGPKLDQNTGRYYGGPSGEPRVPFLTNPTECSANPFFSTISFETWQQPVQRIFADYALPRIKGCDKLEFEPTIEAQPTTNLADAPSGLDFNLHIPQHSTFVGASEVQSLTVNADEGQFNLSFGAETTADLPFFAGSGEIQSALEGLSSIGAGNVLVTGGFDFASGTGTDKIIFGGALANTDVGQLTAADGAEALQITTPAPAPGSATIATSTTGHPPGSLGAELATAQLRDALVTFPAGMTVNPSSAGGLAACTLAQAGISASGQSDGRPQRCPDASKLGTVEAISPAIDHPLPGSLHLAAQDENPFHSLLALYLVIEDPRTGINAKLPGRVETDPQTGRLTVSFANNPQLPLEDLSLHLFKGPRAALRTPSACGPYTTTSALTPWSAPQGKVANPTSTFALEHGPDGGACLPDGPSAPNHPTFSAGTTDPTAKAFSPFVLKLTRADGSQQLRSIDTTLPKGMLAKLAGVASCSDGELAAAAANSGRSEQATPSCPTGSQVGTVEIGAGAGAEPLYVSAKAYLAGPYRGAPISLAIITPAVAGPFDLGTVVTRVALQVDSATAQVHATSDPIPTILQGIPLDIRSVALNMNRPGFTFNPTNCDPSAVLGSATSVFEQTVALSEPFQVGDCAKLSFKPTLKLALKGAVHRRAHPSLRATLTARPGDANIARAQVKLPKAAFLDNAHIGEVCTRVQFAADQCPAGSIYGTASATTPLLDYPLTGNVYLRSSSHKLPDLVVGFNGPSSQPIEVELAGTTDSVKGALRNTFEAVPDVPVTSFHLELFGGKKGLIEMSSGFCKNPNASVKLDGQNGSAYNTTPKVAAKCGKTKHGKRAHT